MPRRALSRRNVRRYDRVTSVAAAVVAALYGSPGAATDVSSSEANGAETADTSVSRGVENAAMLGGLQEVVVTANHRETSAQDLPISITPVTGAALEQAGIADIADLARSMAGVDYTDKGLLRTTQIVILRPVAGCQEIVLGQEILHWRLMKLDITSIGVCSARHGVGVRGCTKSANAVGDR